MILDRWLRVSGIRTHYLTAGNGPAVVLLHGGALGVSAEENWKYTLPFLANAGYSAYAPEIIGSGETDKPSGCHSITAKVQHVKDFIESLCIGSCFLLGNAMGASLAFEIAHDWRERVEGIVVMGGPGVPKGHSSSGVRQLTEIAEAYTREDIRAALMALCNDPTVITEEIVDRRFRLAQLPGAREAFSAFVASPEAAPSMWDRVQDFLPQLLTPVLLIWGGQDRVVTSELGRRLASLLSNSRFEQIDNCGHWVQVERPDIFNRLVLGFLRERYSFAFTPQQGKSVDG